MTLQGVARLLILAKKIHPGIEDSKENALLWKSLLEEYPDEVGLAAMHQFLKVSVYSPKPADIVRIADTMRTNRPPLAEEAWQEVTKKLNQYHVPRWSHFLIEKTVKSLGYFYLCMSDSPEYDRMQFIKTYEKYRENELQEERNQLSLRSTPFLKRSVLGIVGKEGVHD